MAGAAAPCGRKLTTARNERWIDRLAARLRHQRGVVLRQRLQLVVLEILDQRRHGVDLAHAFAHQEQLVDNEKLGLSGKRRQVSHLRIAVLAVTGGTLLDALAHRRALRMRAGERSADRDGSSREPTEQRLPPDNARAHQRLYEMR